MEQGNWSHQEYKIKVKFLQFILQTKQYIDSHPSNQYKHLINAIKVLEETRITKSTPFHELPFSDIVSHNISSHNNEVKDTNATNDTFQDVVSLIDFLVNIFF